MISRVSHMNSPVLLTGETGTGKELAAHEIHRTSKRKNKKMISINCGAIPETLIDSELFGHEKGAFTGAEKLKRGYFEQADGGTIFLDEVGELPLSAQVKLLRVLQTMEFNRIGGNIPVSVDVRIIAATNRDLLHMVEKKSFREDLWFRLNVFPINIPPLRNRKQDIKGLVDYFIKIKAREMNIKNLPLLSEKDLRKLENYDWPGNVRELQNVVERALILGRGQYLGFENFNLLPVEEKTDKRIEKNTDLIKLDDLIKNHIEKTLEHTNCRINGKKGAAQILGINPSTLRSKMKKYNISIRKNT
jgi:transcriptional regulator with GAF, ATPase, and Fis domain